MPRGTPEETFAEARAAADALGVKLRLPDPRPRPHAASTGGPARCDWPWRGAYIACSGDALPCAITAATQRVELGNVAEEGVVAVWDGERYGQLREQLAAGDPAEVCRHCPVYTGALQR